MTTGIFCLLTFLKLKQPLDFTGEKKKIVSKLYVSDFPSNVFLGSNPTLALAGNVFFTIIPIKHTQNRLLFCFTAPDKASVILFKGKNLVHLQF